MHSLMVAALVCVAPAGQAAAQQAESPAVRFDGERGSAVAGILRQAVQRREEAPAIGAVRELRADWSVEIGIGDRYDRYPGGGYTWRWERVKQLAHELQERAEHLHRWAEDRSHHGGYREQQFLRACHSFEQQARHFHRQVEAYRQNPGHTRSDYYQLVSALREVEWAIRSSHADQHVWQDFNRARAAVDELDFSYRGGYDDGDRGGHDDDHGGWPGRPRPRRPRGGHGGDHGRYPHGR